MLNPLPRPPPFKSSIHPHAPQEGWVQEQLAALRPKLERKLDLARPMTSREVEDVWQLCQFEAGARARDGHAASLNACSAIHSCVSSWTSVNDCTAMDMRALMSRTLLQGCRA